MPQRSGVEALDGDASAESAVSWANAVSRGRALAGTLTASKTRAEVKERARVSILVLMGSSIGVPVLVDIFKESRRFNASSVVWIGL